ncbi:TlpA family protein disulfide reductase [Flavilitoribacter nigricans]|uniref:Thioredoxin domain-containing protein n=1 Tax=Flavilitoribacter nigricans (strain ATCC 23147 / DSM 23189 / NBRC 102662 / NCIMB 1420 / SS-2) TaxID=1122177 RepID=A0A2D0MZ22_FLAN2|nr:TlpA disulfide reductase family protein [Flavilitoribacter nigricans]PHN01366.1 hypothetical protein CRP01_37510 [Flavilitoribacter nigricans DSM 23189 = NBRC 102662]
MKKFKITAIPVIISLLLCTAAGEPEMRSELLSPPTENKADITKDRHTAEINFYPKPVFQLGMLGVLQQEKYRGKVLVVDIWGTWCKPCVAQFPHLKAVKAALADQEVEYVYFANEIQAPVLENWKKVVNSFNLTGDHYLTGKDQVFQLMKDIDQYSPRFTYPTYMIVNREGKVVDHDAPKPSEGDELIKRIREVLAED